MNDELTFQQELEQLINKHSLERHSNTPDFILAQFMAGCLHLFNKVIFEREKWYGREGKLTDATMTVHVDECYPPPSKEWWIGL